MRVLFALVLAGCSFSGPGGDGDGDGDGDTGQVDGSITDGISEAQMCPTDSDLLACYRFDLDTADSAGSHDATIVSGQTSFVTGVDGASLSIEDNSIITVANSADFETPGFTIEFWLGPDSGQGHVFDYHERFWVRIYGGNVVRCIYRTSGKQTAGFVIDPTQWNHIACAFDPGPGLQMFVNQAAVASNPNNEPLTSPDPEPAHIGSNSPGGDGSFTGRIDNLRIWNRGLEVDEVCLECDAVNPNP